MKNKVRSATRRHQWTIPEALEGLAWLSFGAIYYALKGLFMLLLAIPYLLTKTLKLAYWLAGKELHVSAEKDVMFSMTLLQFIVAPLFTPLMEYIQ